MVDDYTSENGSWKRRYHERCVKSVNKIIREMEWQIMNKKIISIIMILALPVYLEMRFKELNYVPRNAVGEHE